MYHICGAGRPTNFKIGTPMEHAINCHGQLYEACEGGFLHAGRGILCRPNPAATQLV